MNILSTRRRDHSRTARQNIGRRPLLLATSLLSACATSSGGALNLSTDLLRKPPAIALESGEAALVAGVKVGSGNVAAAALVLFAGGDERESHGIVDPERLGDAELPAYADWLYSKADRQSYLAWKVADTYVEDEAKTVVYTSIVASNESVWRGEGAAGRRGSPGLCAAHVVCTSLRGRRNLQEHPRQGMVHARRGRTVKRVLSALRSSFRRWAPLRWPLVLAFVIGCGASLRTVSEREREEDIPGLVDIALESDDEEVVHAASRALVSLGKRAIPEVSRGLLHQDAEKRWTAAEILGDIGDALALPALRTAYARELDGTVRGIILQGYGNIQEPSLEADLVRARGHAAWRPVRWLATRWRFWTSKSSAC
jgi:hypothetical protein